jgi:hypothetical protein
MYKQVLAFFECGRQDSNLYGLSRNPLSSRGSSSTGFQGPRVCQFRHARIVRGFSCLGAVTSVGPNPARASSPTRSCNQASCGTCRPVTPRHAWGRTNPTLSVCRRLSHRFNSSVEIPLRLPDSSTGLTVLWIIEKVLCPVEAERPEEAIDTDHPTTDAFGMVGMKNTLDRRALKAVRSCVLDSLQERQRGPDGIEAVLGGGGDRSFHAFVLQLQGRLAACRSLRVGRASGTDGTSGRRRMRRTTLGQLARDLKCGFGRFRAGKTVDDYTTGKNDFCHGRHHGPSDYLVSSDFHRLEQPVRLLGERR